jgi:integrase
VTKVASEGRSGHFPNDRKSVATVQKAHQLLGKVMGAAVNAGMAMQSPCRRVPLPKVEREEMQFLTPAEIAWLGDVINPRCRVLVLVAADGGLRIGELAGLRRRRVDSAPGTVEVAEIVPRPGEWCGSGRPRPGRSADGRAAPCGG